MFLNKPSYNPNSIFFYFWIRWFYFVLNFGSSPISFTPILSRKNTKMTKKFIKLCYLSVEFATSNSNFYHMANFATIFSHFQFCVIEESPCFNDQIFVFFVFFVKEKILKKWITKFWNFAFGIFINFLRWFLWGKVKK